MNLRKDHYCIKWWQPIVSVGCFSEWLAGVRGRGLTPPAKDGEGFSHARCGGGIMVARCIPASTVQPGRAVRSLEQVRWDAFSVRCNLLSLLP